MKLLARLRHARRRACVGHRRHHAAGRAGRLAPHSRDELRIRVDSQDSLELGPVVREEADPIDDHVLHLPALSPTNEPVVHGEFAACPGQDGGRDGRRVAGDGLAEVLDPHATGEAGLRADRGDEAALENIGEEPDELVLVVGRPRQPHGAEHERACPPELEYLVDQVPDGLPGLLQPTLRIHGCQDRVGSPEEGLQRRRRRRRAGGPSIDERERQCESEHAGPRDTHRPPQELRRSVFRMRLCHLVQTPLPRFWSCRLHSKVGCRRLRPHTPHSAKEHLACHSRRAPSRRNHSAESGVSRRVPSAVKQGVRKQTHATAQILSG